MSFEETEGSLPLLHLTELVSREPLPSGVTTAQQHDHDPCVIVRRLHTDDATVLDTLSPEDVQGWCLSRIADYRSRISTLRSRPDSVMYNASLHGSVIQLKSNMCALRMVYNDAAPIHRRLPPEILLEIFANFQHDGTRLGHAALRVCHYWHALLQRTPQFWKSLLSREFLGKWESQWKTARFRAAFFKSAPLDLSLRLQGIVPATVNIFVPHSCRITSMAIRILGNSQDWEVVDRFLELDMPLRELEIRIGIVAFYRENAETHNVRFAMFRNLRALRLSSISCEPPQTPHTALKHLELNWCWGGSEQAHYVAFPPLSDLHLQTILATIRNCPNLETLRITGWPPNTLSDLDSPVEVPQLRHIVLQLSSPSMLDLLSRLVLPPTTVLDLEPRFSFADPLPLSTSLVSPFSGHPPAADVAMRLDLLWNICRSKNVATWEARGDECRPLRVSTFLHVSLRYPEKTLKYTQQVLAIYAPGTAVTSLTITGARRAKSKSFWATLLAGLPHLTRLSVDGGDVRDSPMLLPLLAKGQGDGRCLCPRLADLSIFWNERLPRSCTTKAHSTVDPLALEGIDDEGYPPLVLSPTEIDEGCFRQPYGLAVTYAYCRFLELCLRSRVEHGCCSLRTLSVSIWDCWRHWRRRNTSSEVASAVEALLREGLGDLVEEVSVKLQSKWEI